MNVIEAKSIMSRAGNEAQTIVGNKSLSNGQKKSLLDILEGQTAEARQALNVHKRAGELMGGGSLYGGESGLSGLGGASSKGLTGRAPSLLLDPEQQEMMFKSLQDRMPFSTKAATTTANVDPALYPAQYLPPVLAAREPTRILDILPSTAAPAGVIEYYVTTGTAAAAPTLEGADKPESGIAFTKSQASMTKIAHWLQVTEEALTDFSAFEQLVSADMIAGVIDAENRELLNGSGTGASKFKGLLQVAGTGSYTRLTGDTILDALEIAGSELRASGRFTTPDAYILHPLDYSKARRTKDSQGRYIAGDPTQEGPASLWGTRVIQTSEIAQGTALVGNFAQSSMVWIRDGLQVRSNAYGVGFRSNEVEVIAEERLTLGVVAPAALSVVTIADPA